MNFTRLLWRTGNPLVLVREQTGISEIPQPTPLTRLNYYDGKFLRADDLRSEQEYLRSLVALSNQAGGSGVAYGFDTVLASGDSLQVGAGLAIDPQGRVLLLPQTVSVSVQDLIDASRRTPLRRLQQIEGAAGFSDCVVESEAPTGTAVPGTELYLVTIAHAEALCGEEDVYGKLCEEQCITSHDRPWLIEGVVLQARPFTLATPLALSKAVALSSLHLRSLVASAYFADERLAIASLISRDGLSAETWCLGAEGLSGSVVPLAVLARAGSTTLFLDAWTARRERIEAQAKRYWAARMAMRPWDVFLAQVLQFQCQLHELLLSAPSPGEPTDPCAPHQVLLGEVSRYLGVLEEHLATSSEAIVARKVLELGATGKSELAGGVASLSALRQRLDAAVRARVLAPRSRVLIRGGIVELPAAGYLPVVPGTDVSVNTQVRRLLGEGLDLRFCVVHPDFVPHALEEAQHMERISLLQGLDDPARKPEVDVLVPDGKIVRTKPVALGRGWEGRIQLLPESAAGQAAAGASAGKPAQPAAAPAPAGGSTGKVLLEAQAMTKVLHRAGTPVQEAGSTLGVVQKGPVVHGAGRSELLDGGGAAFHFAGATELRALHRPLDFVRGLASFGDVGKGSHWHMLQEVAHAYAESPAEPLTAEELHASVMRIASEAQRWGFQRLAEQPAFEEAKARNILIAHFKPAEPATEGRVIALWATMSCARNPFLLSPGEAADVQFQIDLTLPVGKPSVVSYQVRGRLRAEELLPASGGQRLRGRFSGLVSSEALIEGAARPGKSASVELEVALALGDGAGRAPWLDVTFASREHPIRYSARVTWDGSPLEVAVELDAHQLRSTYRFPLATFQGNDDVLAPGNAVNSLARSALAIVQAALADPGFAAAAEQILFPPPPKSADDLTVQATLDWVLFHRRRTKECAPERPTLAPPPARTYQVWEAAVRSQRDADAVRQALLLDAGDLTTLAGFRMVDVVEFAGGSSTLTSSVQSVQADWQAAKPGKIVQYAAIATEGAGDGEALARARLAAYEAALATVAGFATDVVSEPLPRVPTPLGVQGLDGVIVVITLAAPTLVCQSVYRVDAVSGSDKYNQLAWGVSGEARKKLVDVQFDAETNVIVDSEPLLKAWKKAGGGVAAGLDVYAHQGDPAAGSERERLARARAIAAALGNAGAKITPYETPASTEYPAGDCPVIVAVAPETVCHAVYEFLADATIKWEEAGVIRRALAAGDLAAALARHDQSGVPWLSPLGRVVFDVGASSPAGGSLSGFESPPEGGAVATSIFVLQKAGDPLEESDAVLGEQAAAAVTQAGLAEPPEATVVRAPATMWPTGLPCPIATVIILERRPMR